jgi:hypothetical protein
MRTSASSRAPIPSAECGDGERIPPRLSVARSSCVSTIDSYHDADSAHSTLSEVNVSTSQFLVNLEDAIPKLAAEAVRNKSAKVISLQTGLEINTIYHLRQARNQPRSHHWEAIKKWAAIHEPQVAKAIESALSGDAEASTPENIQKIIANLQRRGGT